MLCYGAVCYVFRTDNKGCWEIVLLSANKEGITGKLVEITQI